MTALGGCPTFFPECLHTPPRVTTRFAIQIMKLQATILAALAFGAFTITPTEAQQAAAFRRFQTIAGKTFYAAVTAKTDAGVSLRLQNGQPANLLIRELSLPDQQFVRKWTKFKDELLNNAAFAKLTVKELLELRGYQSFEFEIQGNHIFVDGEMNGKKLKMMVDTGAQTSLIHLEAAKTAGLEIGPMDQEIFGVGGKAMAAVSKFTQLKLGDAIIENRRVLATDMSRVGGGQQFDAIFGADYLRELDAVISYREGRMFLKPENVKSAVVKPAGPVPNPAMAEFKRWTTSDNKQFVAALHDKNETQAFFRLQNGQVTPLPIERLAEADKDVVAKWDKLRDQLSKNPEWRTLTTKELLELRSYQSFEYRLDGNHILVDGMVNTVKATFLIDTGAHGGVFHIPFAKSAGIEIGPMNRVISGIGGDAPAADAKVAMMKMGDAVITNRVLMAADLEKDRPSYGGKSNHDAIFGADFLRQLDGVINYKEGRIFLKPDQSDKPDEAPKPAEVKPAPAK